MGDKWPGEDIGFSELCNAHDVDLWVDTTTTSPHMIDAWVDEHTFQEQLRSDPDRIKTREEFEERNEELARAKGE